jgi:urease accessory protein UreF
MPANEQNVRALSETDAAQSQAENLLGDFRALLQQIGSPGSSVPVWAVSVDTLPALRDFLEDYLSRILARCELPAIVEACGHGRRGEWRELLVQDLRLEATLQQTPFAEPSRRVGRSQLARLRTLRDERTVQRYLAAVLSGKAHGWHTVVYGLTLGVYSRPLRQGLLYYSQETISALAAAASRSRNLDPAAVTEVLSRLLTRVPEVVAAALQSEDLANQVSMASGIAG